MRLREARGHLAGSEYPTRQAGQYIMAFDFANRGRRTGNMRFCRQSIPVLSGHPAVTADRIVLLKVIAEAIEQRLSTLKHELVAKHVLTKFMMLYAVRQYFRDDKTFDLILSAP